MPPPPHKDFRTAQRIWDRPAPAQVCARQLFQWLNTSFANFSSRSCARYLQSERHFCRRELETKLSTKPPIRARRRSSPSRSGSWSVFMEALGDSVESPRPQKSPVRCACSIPIRHADGAGSVIREAIEGIGGDRTQVGDAAGQSRRGSCHGIVAIVATPVPVCIMAVGMVADGGMQSNRRSARSGLSPAWRRRRLTERGRGRG